MWITLSPFAPWESWGSGEQRKFPNVKQKVEVPDFHTVWYSVTPTQDFLLCIFNWKRNIDRATWHQNAIFISALCPHVYCHSCHNNNQPLFYIWLYMSSVLHVGVGRGRIKVYTTNVFIWRWVVCHNHCVALSWAISQFTKNYVY